MRPQNWDKFEAALLLNACIEIQDGKIGKDEAISQISIALRQMAINKKIEIDDVYRNTNGIQWQLAFMKKALDADKFDTRNPPKLFSDVAELYRSDREQFNNILLEAKKMCKKEEEAMQDNQPSTTKEAFETWYSSASRKYPLDFVIDVYEETFRQSNDKKDITCIWDFTNVKKYNTRHNEIVSKKLFRIIHRSTFTNFEKTWKFYADFLKEYETDKKSSATIVQTDTVSAEECDGQTNRTDETTFILAVEKHPILPSDTVLDYFNDIKLEIPSLEFTNIDAKGVVQRRCVYIFRKDLSRNGHVLLEIWMNRGAAFFTIWAKRALLTEDENKEIDQTHEGASLTRGKIERKFIYAEDLISFVKDKLENAENVDVHDLLKRPRKNQGPEPPKEPTIDETLKEHIISLITSKGISYSWVGFDDFSFDAYCIKGLSKNKIALIKDHITKRAFYLSDLNRTQLKKVVFQKDSSTELSEVFINFGELPNENIETIYCYKDVDEGKIYVYDSKDKISNILNEKYPVDTLWEDMSDQQIETYLEEFSEGDCEIPFSTFD